MPASKRRKKAADYLRAERLKAGKVLRKSLALRARHEELLLQRAQTKLLRNVQQGSKERYIKVTPDEAMWHLDQVVKYAKLQASRNRTKAREKARRMGGGRRKRSK